MPITRSGKDTNASKETDPLILNMKQESVTPPQLFFSDSYLNQTANQQPNDPRHNAFRESSEKDPVTTTCLAAKHGTCLCSGLKIVIPPPSPSIPPCPKNLNDQFKHWDLNPKK